MVDDIERLESDAFQDEYEFAGGMLGTAWEFPDGKTRKVAKVVQETTREQGISLSYPELHFDDGRVQRASQFKSRIDPTQNRDVEPIGHVAHQIVTSMRRTDSSTTDTEQSGGGSR